MLLIFFAVLGLLASYLIYDYLVTARTDALRDRLLAGQELGPDDSGSLWSDAADLFHLAEVREMLYRSYLLRQVDTRIKRANLPFSLWTYIVMVAALTAMAGVLVWFYFSMLWPVVVAVVMTILACWLVLGYLASRRQKQHDDQLPAMISSFITTLRSGGTPMTALQSVAKHGRDPISTSMTMVADALQLGRPPSQAWQEWAEYWDTRATRLLARGVRIKWEAGGQMTSMLQHILDTLEFRKRMELRVSALTAQAKLSAWVLSALPIALFWVGYSFRPDLINAMINDDFGRKLLYAAAIFNVLGFIWLRRMAKLR
ncbi:type II secretion system F family protein [Methylobacillus flagellatus]|uniref:type II secretion system F family protein n=1 Tax=Methylobacillus flagellatus TaxID=405 RepID=UPI0010F71F5F|nr:type II secretion system F family protein [Methylobacillus flagellatus]